MQAARKKASRTERQDDPWVSILEAARILGVHRQTVLGYALAGDLEAQKVAGRMVVTRKSVEKLATRMASETASA